MGRLPSTRVEDVLIGSDPDDEKLYEDIVLFEDNFRSTWSNATRSLLADGPAVLAFKRRAFEQFKLRFKPVRLFQDVDAWNKRGRPRDRTDPKK